MGKSVQLAVAASGRAFDEHDGRSATGRQQACTFTLVSASTEKELSKVKVPQSSVLRNLKDISQELVHCLDEGKGFRHFLGVKVNLDRESRTVSRARRLASRI